MATNFPTSLDAFTNPTSSDTLDNPPHDQQHADVNDAVEALQAKVGVNGSAVTTSLDYRVAVVEQALSGRNIVYNGAMQVAQRGTSVTGITTGGYYTADRWASEVINIGTWTQTVENDAPTGSGFRKSLKMLCTTADAAPAASDIINIEQRLEGQDVQRIKKGTASAEQVTLSFWVKSNVTGTYTILFFDADNSRSVSATYSVASSATWEKKTITFPADTTGAFDNDNATSIRLFFCLGAGSNFTSGAIATTWGSYSAANRAQGQVNVAAATNNYWQVTGVQFEVGPKPTPFEFLPYGVELARCQRYYESVYDGAVPTGSNPRANITAATNGFREVITYIKFAVAKRSSSYTMTAYRYDTSASGTWYTNYNGGSLTLTPTFDQRTPYGLRAYVGSGSLPLWAAAELYPIWTCSDEL